MRAKLEQAKRFAIILTLVSLISLAGCTDAGSGLLSTPPNPAAVLVGYEGCLQLAASEKADDCLEFRFEKGILYIRHINAGFNCCPGEITADIELAENEIVIREKESESACDCQCLFAVDYEITNLTPGDYVVRVDELYLKPDDEPLVCTINLLTRTPGRCCVERSAYPWQ